MCDCIKKFDEALNENYTKLALIMVLDRETNSLYSTFDVKTVKTDDAPRRAKPVSVVPTFCCFCGERIRPPKVVSSDVIAEDADHASR